MDRQHIETPGPELRPMTDAEEKLVVDQHVRHMLWSSEPRSMPYHPRPKCSHGGSSTCQELPTFKAFYYRKTRRGRARVNLKLCTTHALAFCQRHELPLPELQEVPQ